MKLLIDMNLSPKWVSTLRKAGWDAVHWSEIGKPNAPDHDILRFARANGYVIFTHDLDFATILAATKADCPSVIQVRTQDVVPASLGWLVISALSQFQKDLEEGAVITVDQKRLRARVLPIKFEDSSDE
jgi:predicted nuclease of predicted toxin-antitoxin system